MRLVLDATFTMACDGPVDMDDRDPKMNVRGKEAAEIRIGALNNPTTMMAQAFPAYMCGSIHSKWLLYIRTFAF